MVSIGPVTHLKQAAESNMRALRLQNFPHTEDNFNVTKQLLV